MEFDEYFDDVVGVTVNSDSPIEKVLLRVDNQAFNYILTKPLHGSQKVKEKTDFSTLIELNIKMNYEFETLLLGFADRIEILEPDHLKESMRQRARKIIDRNS